MSEKSYPNSHDTDTTRVKSPNSHSESIFHSKPSAATSQSTDADATQATTSHFPDTKLFAVQLEVGNVVKNTYELVQMLGEGGMGTVFKALNKVWQEVEARDPYVAIKVLKPELSANKQLVMSLFRDFDRTKMLANCPNIIKVYGFDRDGPHVYMTMEFLSGKTLSDYLGRIPMSLDQAWFIIEGIGNALAYAHEHNIVHRDIKPGNVIITHDNIVKVLDFGIASKINENEGDETKFGGDKLGALTVAYAAPEMQKDFPPDVRDDIYAFACVIYEILTGKQFYTQKIHKAEPINGLNTRQMDILNKSLAFERNLRTPNIRELLDKLRPVKTPWVKYLSIGGGVVLIIGLVFVVKLLGADQQDPVVTPPEPLKLEPIVVPPELEPIVVPPPVQPRTSIDGVIQQLQTSKLEYKNNEYFRLSFTLTQERYVRVLDRDPAGIETTLRPNPRQPDRLLPANKKQVYPPQGFNSPIIGRSGNGTITVVASSKPFSAIKLLNQDGSVAEQVQNGSYSWVQVRYTLKN